MSKGVDLRYLLVLFAVITLAYTGMEGIIPSSPKGVLLGYIGTFYLLFFLEIYSIKRRTRVLKEGFYKNLLKYHIIAVGWVVLGKHIEKRPAKDWLQLHIWASILGAVLILLHSALSFNGLGGISARIMLIVVISGLTGRYILKQLRKMRRLLGQLEDEEKEMREMKVVRRAIESGEKFLSAWRNMHIPLTNIFYITVIFHVISTYYY